jgi:PAS domain S-box-containing protein
MQNEELRKAQAEIEAGRARYFDLYDLAPVGYATVSEIGLILEANLAAAALLDVPRGALVNQPISRFILKEDQDIYYLHRKKLFETGATQECELRLVKPDGAVFWAHLDATVAEAPDGATACRVVLSDITKRKQAEIVLRESEEKFRSFNEQSFVGFYIIQDGLFKYVNPKFADIFGCSVDECLDNMHFRQFVHPEDLATVEEQIRRRLAGETKTAQYTFRGIRKTGEIIHVMVFGSSLVFQGMPAAIGTMLDITRELELEKRMAQAQKMESIGTLAGGIAHDFNNILSIIVGNTELAMRDLPEWSPAQDNLKEVREATLRARELVKQILLFARRKEHTLSNIRLEPIARESLKMLRSTIPTTVEIREDIEEGLPSVLADPSQIQQIIMNLCTNAGQVMEAEGGTLTFTLDVADLKAPLHTMVEVAPGRYVRLQVCDTGPGIPPEVVERIFDPFFTTKGVGEGTGLGLAVVHGIVLDRNGGITVESEEGRGTTFTVYLPASEVESVEVTAEEKTELPRGTERILFVDDEPMIMKLGQRMLERQGYHVETRASGTDALECFRQDPHRFDLVVTDMTMPGMRGDRLAEEIMAIRPDIPVILCTGYSKQISNEKAREMGIRAFVMKPFTAQELANTVREVLDEKPPK